MTTEPHINITRFAGWTVLAILAVSFVVGVAVLPLRPTDGQLISWWEGICRAVGISLDERTQVRQPSSTMVKAFVWPAELERRVQRADRQAGRDLYEACLPCHGFANRAEDPKVPRIDGMSARVMLKQLHDYARGARSAGLMQPIAQNLTEQEAIDLAAFIAATRRQDPAERSKTAEPGDSGTPTYRLVKFGDPRRGIASCSSCHGPDGMTPDAPAIDGLSMEYAQKQLDDFANGGRGNDLYGSMRMIGRQLTPTERADLARYYSRVRL